MLSNNYTAFLDKYTHVYTCSTIKGGMLPLLMQVVQVLHKVGHSVIKA